MAANIAAGSSPRVHGTCGSGSPLENNAGVPASVPTGDSSEPGGPINPPVKAISPAYRAGWLATNSVARHAPWENPATTIRSRPNPDCSRDRTTESTLAKAELRYGSFAFRGAKNESGYHVFPAACGAR